MGISSLLTGSSTTGVASTSVVGATAGEGAPSTSVVGFSARLGVPSDLASVSTGCPPLYFFKLLLCRLNALLFLNVLDL